MTLKPLKYDSQIVKHNGILLLKVIRDSPIETIKRRSGMIPLASLIYIKGINDDIYYETIGMYTHSNLFDIGKGEVAYRHLIGYQD